MLNKFSNVFKSKSTDIKAKLKDYVGNSLTAATTTTTSNVPTKVVTAKKESPK